MEQLFSSVVVPLQSMEMVLPVLLTTESSTVILEAVMVAPLPSTDRVVYWSPSLTRLEPAPVAAVCYFPPPG